MSPNAQIAAIAKACGWQFYTPSCAVMDIRECDEYQEPPDFLNDLNAMHEAEKTLTKYQKIEYQEQLFQCAYENGERDGSFASWHYIHATAKTRAEAFLKALCLWTES